MRTVYVTIIGMLLVASVARAQPGTPITVSSAGWTVTADGDQGVLTVSRENLGTILQEVRLNLRGRHGLQRLMGWSVEKRGEKQLSIRTSEPPTAWVLTLSAEALTVSATSA